MTYTNLEFDKLLHYIQSHTHSGSAQRYVTTFSPSIDYDHIIHRQSLISDIQKIVIIHGSYDFHPLYQIDAILQDTSSLSFNFEEFKAIIDTISISNIIYTERHTLTDFITYSHFIENIHPFHELQARFYQIFNIEGEVLDSASTELRNIRKTTRRLKDKIQAILNSKLNDPQTATYLQDKVATKRDERYVIPVKEGFAYMIDGISHGRSASGASVFIEPKEVVPLNNELNDLFSAEKAEIYRIFCEFTALIRSAQAEIIYNFTILTQLDAYFACARVSNELQAVPPQIVPENIIELHKARHPLLILKHQSIKAVIPFDATIGVDFRVLLISGPNTGGKSIMLKTVGLTTLMALSGLPIPADYATKIGLFSKIFSDIGDNQSIESSLSTFSGHFQNIKNILSQGDENTLVLIDEIGSATDPEQGSALAQAILEQLVDKKVLAVITTHYTSLKVFAENNPSCKNASMQFDSEKHEPTYKLLLGFPGNSFAIDIAQRLGLPHSLILRATSLTGSQNVELTDLLQKMNAEKIRLAESNYQLDLKMRLLDLKTNELEQKIQALDTEKKKLLRDAISDTQDYLINVQKNLNNELTELKNQSKEEKKQKIAQISKEIHHLQVNLKSRKHALGAPPTDSDDITVGDNVWLTTFDTTARIVDIQKDIYKVDMNGITFECHRADMYKVVENKPPQNVSIVSTSSSSGPMSKKAKIEINLLGKTYDESLPLIHDLIDNAILCGLSKVRIIHGRGTGVLRKKIRDFLKANKKVKEYYSPPQEAGGDGVTVVVV